ncbi:ATP-binding protein [Parablautia intestinalis]|uniref:ATP-binding protein n=1 Tax=Parablautia intestinalis TaxID=2320100 RepID=UPI00256EBD08|nr:ATP-binding protein [Parablautia intestinalis]
MEKISSPLELLGKSPEELALYRAANPPELDGKELAEFRVYKEGGLEYRAMRMNADQISARRIFMRKALRNYPVWGNLPNEELNNIRLYSVGNGWIVEDSGGYEYILRSEKVSKEDTEFRRVRAMMPFDFINLTGSDFTWDKYKAKVTDEKDMVTRYIMRYPEFRKNGMGLYIHSGTKGSGKTMLACCLINEIAKRYPGSVKFVNILDFLEMTKKGFNGDDEDVRAIHQAGLLVVDDIGVQMAKEWIDTVLYRLVNERYVNRLPTVYTSNVPVSRLKIDDRITDRIESTTYTVNLPEESIRNAMRQQEKQKLLDEIKKAPQVLPVPAGQSTAGAIHHT